MPPTNNTDTEPQSNTSENEEGVTVHTVSATCTITAEALLDREETHA